MSSTYWVAPFGNLGINSYLPIPQAYRSLSRPSSPLRAKASSIRPYLLSSFPPNVIKYLRRIGMQLLLRIPKNSIFLHGFVPSFTIVNI